MPIYLIEFRELELMEIGFLLPIPFLTLDVGLLAGGWVASQLIKHGWTLNRSRKTLMVFGRSVHVSKHCRTILV